MSGNKVRVRYHLCIRHTDVFELQQIKLRKTRVPIFNAMRAFGKSFVDCGHSLKPSQLPKFS